MMTRAAGRRPTRRNPATVKHRADRVQGSNAPRARMVRETPPWAGSFTWQNGFTQGQRPNSGMIGPQPVGRANGPQRTIPMTKPAVPQPTEFMENPDFLSACPAMPIQAEMIPIEEEENPNTVINPNQRYPYNQGYPYTSAAEANANAAASTNPAQPESCCGAHS